MGYKISHAHDNYNYIAVYSSLLVYVLSVINLPLYS